MSCAILKLSWNRAGESTVTGGICGTAFFVDTRTALTAHHVLNPSTFSPNEGYKHCGVWIAARLGLVARVAAHQVLHTPGLDLSVIRFDEPQEEVHLYQLAHSEPALGAQILARGHKGGEMPVVNTRWDNEVLAIDRCDLLGAASDVAGYVKWVGRLNISSADIQMSDTLGFEVSFESILGMSGGPVIDQEERVTGMLSLGCPADAEVKKQTFAVSSDELRAALGN